MSNLHGVVISNNPPWTHRPIEIDLSLLDASENVVVSSVLEEKSPSYKQDAIEHIGIKYPDYTYIYTDGSRSSIGRVGASVFIPDHDIELYYRLPEYQTTFLLLPLNLMLSIPQFH